MDVNEIKAREIEFDKLRRLQELGERATVECLIDCLASPIGFVRSEAIRTVEEIANPKFIRIFAMALNDIHSFTAEDAAEALAKLNSDEALKILSNAFFLGLVEKPHYIANAISEFGERGQNVLLKGIKHNSPKIRYFSAKFFGTKDDKKALKILEELEVNDHAQTSFGGLVSTAARRRIKVLTREKSLRHED